MTSLDKRPKVRKIDCRPQRAGENRKLDSPNTFDLGKAQLMLDTGGDRKLSQGAANGI